MKNIIFLILLITSCGISSEKGNWTEKDKNKFLYDVNKIEELELLKDQKNDFIECYLKECENKYSSYFAADQDYEGCKELTLKCMAKILSNGSILGYWSETDKKEFRYDMKYVDLPKEFEKDRIKLIECYLNKCEINFDSYYKADQDSEKCEELALECFNIL